MARTIHQRIVTIAVVVTGLVAVAGCADDGITANNPGAHYTVRSGGDPVSRSSGSLGTDSVITTAPRPPETTTSSSDTTTQIVPCKGGWVGSGGRC